MDINFTFAGFDSNYCFTTWNQFGADMVQRIAGETDGDATFFNDGDTTPSPDNRVYPWTPQSFSGSAPPAFMYHYVNGAWIMPNPMPTGAVIMYEGSEASIETFDGGEAGAITDTTGPMWEKVTQMNARFPIGPGTLPSTAVVALGADGGEEEVELIEENIPVHDIEGYTLNIGANASSIKFIADDDRNTTANIVDTFGGDVDGATVPHSNLPPYHAIWFIRRTARKMYRRPA